MKKRPNAIEMNNELEAQYFSKILKENEIPHVINSNYDSAYDGLFQSQRGWGHIEVPQQYMQEASTLLEEFRSDQNPDEERDE